MVLTLVLAFAFGQTESEDIGSRRQYWFNGQSLIADSSRVSVHQQKVVKHPSNPVMVADKPWEGKLIQLYSADVHYDAASGQWQMWYEGHPKEVLVCTAFSKDGIRWNKPSLGLQEWNGRKDNNIILQTGYLDAHCMSIVKAPNETDPARRYKLYYWVGPQWFNDHVRCMDLKADDPAVVEARRKIATYKTNGHYVAFSPDGVRFTPKTDAPAIASSDANTTFFDERTGRYRSYHKIERKKPEWSGLRRCFSMSESDDGVRFTPSVPVLEPSAEDDAWVKSLGGLRTEFYGVHVWPQDGFYLGFLWVFSIMKVDPVRGMGWDDGANVTYLIYSKDGTTWNRLPVREPLIPLGPPGSFDAGSTYSSGDRPVVLGNEVRLYYCGVGYSHGNTDASKWNGGVGLATLPRDRYVGWQAKSETGTLATRPIRFTGRELRLNLDARRGETRVAILDEQGRALPGYDLKDCEPLKNDGFETVVKWSGGDLSSLAGKPVRLQFSMRNSVLYTWQFQ